MRRDAKRLAKTKMRFWIPWASWFYRRRGWEIWECDNLRYGPPGRGERESERGWLRVDSHILLLLLTASTCSSWKGTLFHFSLTYFVLCCCVATVHWGSCVLHLGVRIPVRIQHIFRYSPIRNLNIVYLGLIRSPACNSTYFGVVHWIGIKKVHNIMAQRNTRVFYFKICNN